MSNVLSSAAVRAWVGAALCVATPALHAELPAFVLPAAGCPMAHCDSRMSDFVNQVSPVVAGAVRIDTAAPPARVGLGCVSNTRLVACTGGGDPAAGSNLIVYDGDGQRVWDDGGVLGDTAWLSAALISEGGHVIAADQHRLLRADPVAGTILWQSAKPDTGAPISPVMVGTSGIVLLTTLDPNDGTTAEVSTWDAATGALLAHGPLTIGGKVYVTRNTPAVRSNRAYVLASAAGDDSDGRLVAIDVCDDATCARRGELQVAWSYAMTGPSGASPLLIGTRLFFDGRRGTRQAWFYAVDDLGSAPALAWRAAFDTRFDASAAQDPRGGLWVYPWQGGALLRLDPASGAVVQSVGVSAVLGLAAVYSPVTAVSVSVSTAGAVVLTFGAQAKSASEPAYIAVVDVSSAGSASLLWKYKVATSARRNAATGQFPIVTGVAGGRRVVFRGTTGSTFFVGEP